MNEKFFDLKKEKQDRMINAGLRIFALNGYHHASTDDIVNEARISKGLLFHYFGSKSGYYAFLYDYATRYAILELTSVLKESKGMDYFDVQKTLLRIETGLMQQYPFLFLFLNSAGLEEDAEGLAVLATPELSVSDYYANIQADADISRYLHVDSQENLTKILHHTKLGVMRELFAAPNAQAADYSTTMTQYLTTLQRLASAL
ncbi:transcriptional regulator, TetR family [Lachnospiraceae bacterium NK3A20]|nr:transcriptional regulator, TetR family [Lachnospiraceae bacterium NK3A20]